MLLDNNLQIARPKLPPKGLKFEGISVVNFVQPRFTKTRVRNAGKRIVDGRSTSEDDSVLENFRGAHAYILNTFQANIRNHSKGVARTVGQRLKRRNTIIDKLRREPSMPLSSMHDIAGCRMVFESIPDLENVRGSMHTARWKHKLTNDPHRYDYIRDPKPTGYRGVHDVYEYKVGSFGGTPWNGLKVEIQYRTLPQHAWATAVEVADLITSNRIKFSDAKDDYLNYFRLTSEIIARTAEDSTSCLGEMSNRQLKDEFRSVDRKLDLLHTLDNLRGASQMRPKFRKNTLLIFRLDVDEADEALEVRTYENVNRAIDAYDELERELGEVADIVLVRGESEGNIRDAFRNYFSDAKAFVDLVSSGLKLL